jgi:hypothetical protein
MFFRELSTEEAKDFRQWARDNYQVGTHINEVWHPIVQDECETMNNETTPSPNGK